MAGTRIFNATTAGWLNLECEATDDLHREVSKALSMPSNNIFIVADARDAPVSVLVAGSAATAESVLAHDIKVQFAEAATADGKKATVQWEYGTQCFICKTIFTWAWPIGSQPRHHCRNCGRSVCQTHSQHNIALPQAGPGEHRVCDPCYRDNPAASDVPPLLQDDLAKAQSGAGDAARIRDALTLVATSTKNIKAATEALAAARDAQNRRTQQLRFEATHLAKSCAEQIAAIRAATQAAETMEPDFNPTESHVVLSYRSPKLRQLGVEFEETAKRLEGLAAQHRGVDGLCEAYLSFTLPAREFAVGAAAVAKTTELLGTAVGETVKLQGIVAAFQDDVAKATALKGDAEGALESVLSQAALQEHRERRNAVNVARVTLSETLASALSEHEATVAAARAAATADIPLLEKGEQAMAEAARLIEQLVALRRSLDTWQAERTQVMEHALHEDQRFRGNVFMDLTQRIAQLERENAELRAAVGSSAPQSPQDGTVMQSRLRAVDEALADKERGLAQVTKARAELEAQLEQTHLELAQREEERRVREAEVARLATLAHTNRELFLDLVAARRARDEVVQSKDALERTAAELQANAAQARADAAQQRSQLAQLLQERSSLNAQVQAYEIQAQALAADLERTRARGDEAEGIAIRQHEALVRVLREAHPSAGAGIDTSDRTAVPELACQAVRAAMREVGELRLRVAQSLALAAEVEELRTRVARAPSGGVAVLPPLAGAPKLRPVAAPVAAAVPAPAPAAPKPAAAVPVAAAAAPPAAAAAGKVDEDVRKLRDMGFDEARARQALEDANGDLHLATAMLLSE